MGHIPKPILDTIKSVVPNFVNFIVSPNVAFDAYFASMSIRQRYVNGFKK